MIEEIVLHHRKSSASPHLLSAVRLHVCIFLRDLCDPVSAYYTRTTSRSIEIRATLLIMYCISFRNR